MESEPDDKDSYSSAQSSPHRMTSQDYIPEPLPPRTRPKIPALPEVRPSPMPAQPPRRYFRDGPVTYRLYENVGHGEDITENSSLNSSEPDVLYVAEVFSVEGVGQKLADAEYQHSMPLAFDRVATEKDPSPVMNPRLFNVPAGAFRASWTGPIITIWRKALARFQQQKEPTNENSELGDGMLNDPRTMPRIKPNVPDYGSPNLIYDFDTLSFERVAQNRLYIHSPFLYKRLRSFAGYYPSFFDADRGNLLDLTLTHWSQTKNPAKISEPWSFLFHVFPLIEDFVHKMEVGDAQTEVPDDVAKSIIYLERKHTHQLHKFLKPRFETIVQPLIAELAQDSPSLPFHMLWYIFAPGTDVYVRCGETFQTMVVAQVKSNTEQKHDTEDPSSGPASIGRTVSETKLKYWSLDLWYLDMTDLTVGRVMVKEQMHEYPGTRLVTSLNICPTAIWDRYDHGLRRRGIFARSKLLIKASKEGHLFGHYNGPIIGTTKHVSLYLPG